MTDDDLLKQLGRRAREQESEAPPADAGAFDSTAEDRAVLAILGENADSKPAPKPAEPAKVIRPRRWAVVAGPLAAAAAIALFVATRSSNDALPVYELSVVGEKGVRAPQPNAAPATEVLVDPAGDFELVARPLVATSAVTVKPTLVRNGVAAVWSQARPEISSDGAVRIAGPTRQLFPETTGEYELVLAIAKTGDERVVRARIRFAEKK